MAKSPNRSFRENNRPQSGSFKLWIVLAATAFGLIVGVSGILLFKDRLFKDRSQSIAKSDEPTPPKTPSDGKQPKPDAKTATPSKPPAAKAPVVEPEDPDFENENLQPLNEKIPTIRTDVEHVVDAVGNAAVKADIKAPPALHSIFRMMLTSYLQPAGKVRVRTPKPETVMRMFNVEDEVPGFVTSKDAQFGDESIHFSFTELGHAKHEDGRWVCLLSPDLDCSYEMVTKERSQKVILRRLKKLGAFQMVDHETYLLPAGARHIELISKPHRLVFQMPPPPAKPGMKAQTPALELTAKPRLMSALAKQYGNPRFASLWAARSVFTNSSSEVLADYQVRFRLKGYSEWSGWNRSDVIYPAQTVADRFVPTLDHAKLLALQSATPAEIEAEYEYTRPNGQQVRSSRTAPTKLLGMNDGVFTDVEITEDLTWYELFKNIHMVLATFTAASDPVVEQLSSRINKSIGAANDPKGSDEHALRFLEALYNLMRNNIAYQSARGNILDGLLHQHLKFARDVLRDKSGTCINTSIFYASCVEAAGLDAYIVVVPGHAFAAVRLPKSKKFVFVETTGCGGGTMATSLDFTAARREGDRKYQEAAAQQRLNLVDIAEWRRQGVSPPDLPRLNATILDDWKVVFPAMVATGPPELEPEKPVEPKIQAEPSATVQITRHENVVRNGKKGVAFHVRTQIQNANDEPLVLVAAFIDENEKIVRSADKTLADPDGYLVLLKLLLKKDGSEDTVLFLPLDAIPGGRGEHHFEIVLTVLRDGKSIAKAPVVEEFSVTK